MSGSAVRGSDLGPPQARGWRVGHSQSERRYPAARRLAEVESLHGHVVADPYRWLEDPSSRHTRRWLREQRVLASAELGALPGKQVLRELLRLPRPAPAKSPAKVAGNRRFRLSVTVHGVTCVQVSDDRQTWRTVAELGSMGVAGQPVHITIHPPRAPCRPG